MVVDNSQILKFIPQRPPFVMVDGILEVTDSGGITELALREDNIFIDEGEFSASGLLENMAQSCALRIGYINCTSGGTVRQGVIGGIHKFTIYRYPKCHEVIRTYINIEEEVFNLTLASLVTKVGDEVIASATIKIALAEPVE